jgi:hypothetical protein
MADASAAQSAHQSLQQETGAQQTPKQGASKFDGVLADKAQQVGGADALQPVQQPDALQKIRSVYQMDAPGTHKTSDPKAASRGAVSAKSEAQSAGNLLGAIVNELEEGQLNLDRLIEAGANGKDFTTPELLALQAGMYKYSQELDLTSKVVEKATTGLKDTLKTQV